MNVVNSVLPTEKERLKANLKPWFYTGISNAKKRQTILKIILFFQKMLHRKKIHMYRENQLKSLRNLIIEDFGSLAANSKEENAAKISLNNYDTIRSKALENTNIDKKILLELATNLVKKLPTASNEFYSITVKDCYGDILSKKKKQFDLVNKFLACC